ncbi:hypothetical protein ACIA5H_08455 [Nocardia sp. NPDC051900]
MRSRPVDVRAVPATLDYATTTEDLSFQTADFHAVISKLTAGRG